MYFAWLLSLSIHTHIYLYKVKYSDNNNCVCAYETCKTSTWHYRLFWIVTILVICHAVRHSGKYITFHWRTYSCWFCISSNTKSKFKSKNLNLKDCNRCFYYYQTSVSFSTRYNLINWQIYITANFCNAVRWNLKAE